MQPIATNEFLAWAAKLGIGSDPAYPQSRRLTFLPPREHSRFWVFPHEPDGLPDFFGFYLEGMDSWQSVLVWPRSGQWPVLGQSGSDGDAVRHFILGAAGVPSGSDAALKFASTEYDALNAVVFASLVFGWCTEDDLVIIPDHGEQLITTDHHGVIHIECRTEERMARFVEHMAASGYELPTRPPDGTFRWKKWMAG